MPGCCVLAAGAAFAMLLNEGCVTDRIGVVREGVCILDDTLRVGEWPTAAGVNTPLSWPASEAAAAAKSGVLA